VALEPPVMNTFFLLTKKLLTLPWIDPGST
jgi:hypothetical protein